MAAITVATFVMHEKTGIQGFEYLAFVLLAMLTSIILMLLVKTTRAIMGKEICVPE
jgi:tellurite resistance protein